MRNCTDLLHRIGMRSACCRCDPQVAPVWHNDSVWRHVFSLCRALAKKLSGRTLHCLWSHDPALVLPVKGDEMRKPRKAADDHSDLKLVAARLHEKTPDIMRRWEERVREDVPAADQQDYLVLRNHVPHFLTGLEWCIKSGSRRGAPSGQDALSNEHGEQRAGIEVYSIAQVLLEYGLLRETIFQVLEDEAELPLPARDIILNSIESASQAAGAVFMRLRQ